jgi:hypothetical protein
METGVGGKQEELYHIKRDLRTKQLNVLCIFNVPTNQLHVRDNQVKSKLQFGIR